MHKVLLSVLLSAVLIAAGSQLPWLYSQGVWLMVTSKPVVSLVSHLTS
jgi:hypothetical protein